MVDTSIWIDYFRTGDNSPDLDLLIDENLVVTNDIILAELIPYLKIKKQIKVINLLYEINRIPMQISWEEIIVFQVECLKSGASGVGIPDLIIAQNAKINNCKVYSLDKHFRLLNSDCKCRVVRMIDSSHAEHGSDK